MATTAQQILTDFLLPADFDYQPIGFTADAWVVTAPNGAELEFGTVTDDGEDFEGGAAQLEVICATGEGETKRHLLGLSDNVSYVVEQTEANATDGYHYRFILRPETVIPNVDVETSR